MSFKRDEPLRGPPSTVQSDRQAFSLTFTPAASLESQVNLTYMFLDCGSKQEHPERTYTGTGKTCNLHRKEQEDPGRLVDINRVSSCCEATTVQPVYELRNIFFKVLYFGSALTCVLYEENLNVLLMRLKAQTVQNTLTCCALLQLWRHAHA